MEIELVGQAKRVFDGVEVPGPGWDELIADVWATLDWIRDARDARLGPDFHEKRGGFVYQFVRNVADPKLSLAISKEGIGYVVAGTMPNSGRVVYHRIDPWSFT